MTKADTISLRRPDDWHVHLRDGAMLNAVAPLTARQFARAIVMPNLAEPITTRRAAEDYRRRIMNALGKDAGFMPLMTCYLTDTIEAGEVASGFNDGVWAAAKLYPAGATTNSAHGVTDIIKIDPVLEKMSAIGMPLLVHGEVTDPDVDIFDREARFIERVLIPLMGRHPALKIVFEHVTTAEAVDFVREHRARMGATVTAHHLMINRNALFRGGIRPHMYCLPVAKRETHRLALVRAATSGEGCFFLGTDTAPHTVAAKESSCGCAGIFTAATALELYAGVFDSEGRLDKLEAFASLNGASFYGLPVNEDRVTLTRDMLTVPQAIEVEAGEAVRPFMAGETLDWRQSS